MSVMRLGLFLAALLAAASLGAVDLPAPDKAPVEGAGAEKAPTDETGGKDKIITVDGEEIACLVNEDKAKDFPDFVVAVVEKDGVGVVVKVPRARVKKIEYSFSNRAKKLKEDDFKGRYELGLWAFSNGQFYDAARAFEEVKGREGVPGKVGFDLAKAYEKQGDKERAAGACREYLRDHPDDAEAKTFAEKLCLKCAKEYEAKADAETSESKAKATYAKAYAGYVDYLKLRPDDAETKTHADELAAKHHLSSDGTPIPEKPKVPEDLGLEATLKWQAVDPLGWKANPCELQIKPGGAEGNKVLTVQTHAGNENKCVIEGSLSTKGLDLSESKELILKLNHNCPAPVQVAFAFINGQGGYFESKLLTVKGGKWENLTLPVTGPVFKCLQSQWNYTAKLEGREDIRRIAILIYGVREATLWFDYMYFR